MTIVLYIPFKNGSILISDRLNTINENQKTQIDKIIQLDEHTVISFCGSTDHCKYIIDIIKQQKRELGIFEISKIIRENLYELRRESGFTEDIEFLVVRNHKTIKVWTILNGVQNELDPETNHAIGLYHTVIPNLELSLNSLPKEAAIQFGTDLIGWASRIENKVGSPNEYGCNICLINYSAIVIDKIFNEIQMQNMLYRFETDDEPVVQPLAGRQVILGFISATTTNLQTELPFIKEIIEPDLNEYASKIGYNVNFKFLVENADGQPSSHLEKVQSFKNMGVNLIVSSCWSSQAQASLSYVNSNDMLLFSTASTSPTLAISNDRLFRMCAADSHLAPALADVMWAAGVKSIIIFQRGDSWGDGIVNLLTPYWKAKGGQIDGKVRYSAEAIEFTNYLTAADQQVAAAVVKYGGERQRVGVVILSFNEISVILKQVSSYPNMYNVHWWGSDGTAKSQRAMDDAPDEANHIGIYSLLSREMISVKYMKLEARYNALTKQQFSIYTAYIYDAAWAIAKSILETGSTDASKISTILPEICYDLFGISGWCRLNEFGDRAPPIFDVWGFFKGEDKPSISRIIAQYNSDTKNTTFFLNLMEKSTDS